MLKQDVVLSSAFNKGTNVFGNETLQTDAHSRLSYVTSRWPIPCTNKDNGFTIDEKSIGTQAKF